MNDADGRLRAENHQHSFSDRRGFYSIILSSVFQALGKGLYSLSIFLRAPDRGTPASGLSLSRIGGLNMVWWSYPLAELLSLTLCIFFFARVNRNILSQLKSPTDDEKERRKKSFCVRAMKKCGEEQWPDRVDVNSDGAVSGLFDRRKTGHRASQCRLRRISFENDSLWFYGSESRSSVQAENGAGIGRGDQLCIAGQITGLDFRFRFYIVCSCGLGFSSSESSTSRIRFGISI